MRRADPEAAFVASVNRLAAWRKWAALACILLLGALLRTTNLDRAGYSIDEEITALAVGGIRAGGIPILPSGAFYERGLPYSYLAWLSGAWLGHELPSYRYPAMFSGLVLVILVYVAAARRFGAEAGLLGAFLASTFPLLVLASQWARAYTMFAAFFVLAIHLADASQDRPALRKGFLASLFVARLLHELAVGLLIAPLFYALSETGDGERRRRSLRLLAASILVLAGAQAAIYAAYALLSAPELDLARHHAEIHQAATFSVPLHPVVRRVPEEALLVLALAGAALPWVVFRRARFEAFFMAGVLVASALFQLGAVVVAVLLAVVLRPTRAGFFVVFGLGLGAASLLGWTVTAALVSHVSFARLPLTSMAAGGLAHPLSAAVVFVRAWPVASAVLALAPLVTWRLADTRRIELLRAAWCAALAAFVLLGVLRVGMRPRYVLHVVAIVCILAAVMAWTALARAGSVPSWVKGLGAALLVGGLLVEQASSLPRSSLAAGGRWRAPWAVPMRTFPAEAWREAVRPYLDSAVVFCNDELACAHALGRVDHWILSGDADLRHATVGKGAGRVGIYAGAPVVSSLETLVPAVRRIAHGSDCLLVFTQTGKFTGPTADEVRDRLEREPDLEVQSERHDRMELLLVRARLRAPPAELARGVR